MIMYVRDGRRKNGPQFLFLNLPWAQLVLGEDRPWGTNQNQEILKQVESPMKWGIIRIHFQVTLDADERFKQNSPKKELPVIYFCEHNFFQKVEGNNLQISSGQKKCREILQYPFFSFSSTTFPQHVHSTILYFEMLTSLLGVRSSLFCWSSWPPFRTPLLPSRCSPRCNASTLESGSQGLRTPIYI